MMGAAILPDFLKENSEYKLKIGRMYHFSAWTLSKGNHCHL